jgi:hypothetical protein
VATYAGGSNGDLGLHVYPPGAASGTTALGKFTVDGYPFNDDGDLAFDASGCLYAASWAADQSTPLVLRLPPVLSAPVKPLAALGGPSTGFRESLWGFTVAPDGTIYVLSDAATHHALLVFAPGAEGDAAPIRTVAAGGYAAAHAPMAVGPGGELYVAFPESTKVDVYAPGATSLLRTLFGPHTLIESPQALAVGADGTLYVANASQFATVAGEILVFEAGASGDTAPLGVLTADGPASLLPTAIATSAEGWMYIVQDSARARRFPTQVDGAVTPTPVGPPKAAAYTLAVAP